MPGGTGYLGRHLARRLVERGDRVTVLSRDEGAAVEGCEVIHWDARTVGPWADALEGADAIVHLSGKRVDCRPTKRNVDELIRSRVEPVQAVGGAWHECKQPPPVWVQLSSLAGFGHRGEQVIDESTPPPTDGPRQMVDVCRQWEAAFASVARDVPRTVLLRPAIAIGPGDPATRRLAVLARYGLGGRVASGKQWVSWVSLDDCLSVIVRAIDCAAMMGLYHVTSPSPIRNAEMMACYREAVGRRIGLRSPKPVTTIGAWLLGSDPALALTGRRGIPTRLVNEGYNFRVQTFRDALGRALSR